MAGLATKATAYANKLSAQMRPHFDEFWKYAKVELAPPLPADFVKIRKTVEKSSKYAKDIKSQRNRFADITISQVWLNTLVTVEVVTWFFMGECIGKRHIVGYKV
ncbi:ATP synthase subunit g, mitochondrial [Scaptodrosophila lebanonensis]|uniref:ATP synthase subunit g, mitochondrial n=1 Tax=Drosophila lebanonensis TaxID=7225 RepID=A0A6J2UA64_DROLE|nr:ATP synthase subunit g, mitochondrial [Scaptodrosophila lebanonensis]